MGYQESFVTTVYQKDFDTLLERINLLGKEYYLNYGAAPTCIIKAKKDIPASALAAEWEPDAYAAGGGIRFLKGTRLIYFAGDRAVQRTPNRLLNYYDPEDTSWNEQAGLTRRKKGDFDVEVDIAFSETVDCDLIFDEHSLLHDGLENDYIKVTSFAVKTFPQFFI
ncbi:hypothetical protein AGMMS49944_19010 [Spirochaetia bacterium]|nr:hypothetical protein AGMMS49944_19010 [Spirochaetia bacterium]